MRNSAVNPRAKLQRTSLKDTVNPPVVAATQWALDTHQREALRTSREHTSLRVKTAKFKSPPYLNWYTPLGSIATKKITDDTSILVKNYSVGLGFFCKLQVNWILYSSLLHVSFFFKQTWSHKMGEKYNTGAKVLLSVSSEAERTTGSSPGKATKNSTSLDSS